MSQQQELGLRAQVLDVVPPGPIHRNRRSLMTKFSHRIPNFRDPGSTFTLAPDTRAQAVVEHASRKKDETASKLRSSAQQQQQQQLHQQRATNEIKVPLLLEQRPASAGGSGPPAAVFKGAPEAGGATSVDGLPLHYILFRSGSRVTAFPADQWLGFKPHVDRRGLVDSVAAANAAAAGAAGRNPGGGKARDGSSDPFALRLVPKSQRMEKQRQDEEARERQEQVAAGRLLPLAGAVDDELGGQGGGRLKRFVDEDELEAELFGNDEEEEGPRFGGKVAKGARKARGRGSKTADGEELEEDEVPEDLYAGPAVDEDLRPERPEEAEDWEHEFAPDDDDQDQGADDEVYEDDPGLRKKLGIEGDDEDEGEEADEQARKLKKLGDPDDSDEEEQKKEEEEAAKKQQAAAASGGSGEEEDEQEDDEDELAELDEMEEDEKPKPAPQPARPPSAPPVAPKPAAATALAPATVTGAKRKVAEEARQPADGTKRARTATPPPPQAAAAAAAPGGVAGGPKPVAAPAQQPPSRHVAAAGVAGAAPGLAVTAEEVIELLRAQPSGIMPFTDFTRHFSKRTTTPELRNGLKSLTVSLCKSSKEGGVLMVSLKSK